MLPNLLSGQGRIALMTLAIGFMIDGPLASIQENIKKVAESFTCLYKLLNQVCYGFVLTILHVKVIIIMVRT